MARKVLVGRSEYLWDVWGQAMIRLQRNGEVVGMGYLLRTSDADAFIKAMQEASSGDQNRQSSVFYAGQLILGHVFIAVDEPQDGDTLTLVIFDRGGYFEGKHEFGPVSVSG